MIETARLRLRTWREGDRQAFAAMNADSEVMADLGGPLTHAESDTKFDAFRGAFDLHGIGRWALESREGTFLGYAGVRCRERHVIGRHFDVAWRLVRRAWGRGYATEAAAASLRDAFTRTGMAEILAYASPHNLRSHAVMHRLGLARDPSRDFRLHDGRMGEWRGWVWLASRP